MNPLHLSAGQLAGLAVLAVFAIVVIADWRWGIFSKHKTNQSRPREPLYPKDVAAAAEWDEEQRTGPAVLDNLRQLHEARYGYVRPPEPGNGHHRAAAVQLCDPNEGQTIQLGEVSNGSGPAIAVAVEAAPPLEPLPEQDERLWTGTMIGQRLHRERPHVEVPQPVLMPTAVMSREQLVADRVRDHYAALETDHWNWLNHEVEIAKKRSAEEWRGWSMLMMHAITA